MLSARKPVAVEARAAVGHFVPVAVLNALAQALPERVPAESTAPVQGIGLRGTHKGRPFAGLIFVAGGQGAHAGGDGAPCLTFPTNVNCTPAEIIEQKYPVRVLEKSLIPDSGGSGRHRGGLGQRLSVLNVGDSEILATVLTNRSGHPARGRLGGGAGRPERILVNGRQVTAARALGLKPGDVLTLECPGGGGWGPPAQRDAAAIEEDRRNGVVTAPA